MDEINIGRDLARIFTVFVWNIKGFIDTGGNIYPIPEIPQVITGLFQEITKTRVKEFIRQNYRCQEIQGGAREYPEITLFDGLLGSRKIAIDMKTSRRVGPNRISGFTLGSYAGYFAHPDRKMAGCVLPYGEYTEHWVVGFIYDWMPGKPSEELVSNVEVIVQEKWRMAARHTGTGTTNAIGSVREIDRLKVGSGDFSSEAEFEEYWRSRYRERNP